MLYNGRNEILNFMMIILQWFLKLKIKAAEEQEETGLKILTPKQMLQRLLLALAQVKAGNNSESTNISKQNWK